MHITIYHSWSKGVQKRPPHVCLLFTRIKKMEQYFLVNIKIFILDKIKAIITTKIYSKYYPIYHFSFEVGFQYLLFDTPLIWLKTQSSWSRICLLKFNSSILSTSAKRPNASVLPNRNGGTTLWMDMSKRLHRYCLQLLKQKQYNPQDQ